MGLWRKRTLRFGQDAVYGCMHLNQEKIPSLLPTAQSTVRIEQSLRVSESDAPHCGLQVKEKEGRGQGKGKSCTPSYGKGGRLATVGVHHFLGLVVEQM